MADILTPLQALVALLGECERSLDFRPKFRAAMANAHTAIVNAPAANREHLDGSIWLDLPTPVACTDPAETARFFADSELES